MQTQTDIAERPSPRFLLLPSLAPATVHRIRSIIFVLFGLAAVLCLTSIGRQSLTPTLDNSWAAVITYVAAKPLQFGRDIIFTYGPLGHLVSATYSSKLFLPELAANIAINALYVTMVFGLSRRLRPVRRFAFVVIALLAAFGSWQAMFLFMLVAAGWLAFSTPARNKLLLIVAVAFLAVASLVKATFLFFALFVMICGLANLGLQQNVRQAFIRFSLFVVVFLTAWAAAGQEFANIPSYLWSSFEIMRGYSAAMSLPPREVILAAGIAGVTFALIQIAMALVRNRDEQAAWFMSLVLLAALFLSWKLGYTRADAHTVEFFYYAIIVAFGLPIFYSRPPAGKAAIFDWAIIAMVVTCGLFVIRDQTLTSPWRLCREMWGRFNSNVHNLVHLERARLQIEESAKQDAQALALPEIRQIIDRATVDVFGVVQATAIANSFNYTPRPIFQGYSAYTPALVKINSAYYRSARAPQYAIFKLDVIDSHVPTLEDADVFLLLARDYRSVLAEKGHALLKRRTADSTGTIELKVTQTGESPVGRPIPIPRGVVWGQLNIRETWLGKLIGFLYQPPQVWVEFESADRPLPRKRIPLPLAANGFLINPLPFSDREFLQFAQGDYQGSEIRTITILPSAPMQWLMHARIDYRFSEITMPLPVEIPVSP